MVEDSSSYPLKLNDDLEINFDCFSLNTKHEFISDDKLNSFYSKNDLHQEQMKKKLFKEMMSEQFDFPYDWEYSKRREMQQIIPGLFIGPYASVNKSKKPNLQALGITHIVCIRHETEAVWIKPNFPDLFEYLTLNISDSLNQNIIPFFEISNNFIKQAFHKGGKVVVHSNAGISRSAAIVIAFLMSYINCSFEEATHITQRARFCIFPNESFKQQLLEYEPILRASRIVSSNGDKSSNKRTFTD